MEEGDEKKFVCKFCHKTFPSGKSLGGHIRIHSNENSAGRYNGNKMKRLVDQREKQQQQECSICGKGFVSLNVLTVHMTCHSEGEKMLMDSQSDTESETSSTPTRKRFKKVMRRSSSESLSNGSLSFASEIDQEIREAAYNLMMMKCNLVMNSLGESSDNNSVTVETMSSAGEDLKILNVKNQVLETDKVVDDDQLRSADDNGVIPCDSDSSDSEYFLNGPKTSDSYISDDGYLGNTRVNNSLNGFKNSDERRSKYELSKSKRVLYETDSCADTNSKIQRYRESKAPMVKKAGGEKKKSKGHECPICFKVFKSGQALGGHKRSHTIGQCNQEHNQVSEMHNQIDLDVPDSDNQFDLNAPASDNDE